MIRLTRLINQDKVWLNTAQCGAQVLTEIIEYNVDEFKFSLRERKKWRRTTITTCNVTVLKASEQCQLFLNENENSTYTNTKF